MQPEEKTSKYAVIIIFLLTLVAAGFLHGWNMFHFPYYESDEGTYVSQAWSVVKEGKLAPYTYWYDHPPMGWNLIALWTQLFGGNFFVFGTAIDMGRAFMLVIHLISTALIFYIVQRIVKNPGYAFLAGLLFSISPLVIYFQRRVLLDNILIMWILASIALLFAEKLKLRHYIWSGIFFALAVLTKVTAVMFGPAILLFVLTHRCEVAKIFRTTLWLTVSIMVTSLYVLYAILRGEFLPQGIGSNMEHVSLITSFFFQMGRSSNVPFWQAGSDFLLAARDWMNKDQIMVGIALGGIVLSGIGMIWYKNLRLFMVAALLYGLFLIRGGVVLNFYLLPLVPFVAILIAIFLHNVIASITSRRWLQSAMVILPLGALIAYYALLGPRNHFLGDETIQQKEAVVWIKENLPVDTSIIIDVYSLVDLWDPTYVNAKSFTNADWFYKINRDPQIRDKKYKNNWRNFEYIGLTHEMLKQIEKDDYPIAKEAYQNSFPVAKWTSDNSMSYVDEQKFISTNGDWAMIFKVNGTTKAQLLESWNYYKNNFIHSYGQVIDPSNGVTTSEGQSYALLWAAWMNDKEMFKGVWLWTKDHMQFRLEDKLFSWKWEGEQLTDTSNATDADQDIAAALLFGYRIWGEEEYLNAAKEIIRDIWKNTVVEVDRHYYLLPMHQKNAEQWNGYLFNVSYLSPMWYRIFAEVDPEHDWNRLAADSYAVLHNLGQKNGKETYLPPDWALLDKKTGKFSSANAYFDHDTDNFSFDAFRTFWRVSLDYQWNQNEAALEYLTKVNQFLVAKYEENGSLPAVVSPTGQVIIRDHSLSVDAGYLAALMYYEDKALAIDFYEKFIEAEMSADNKYWGDEKNYYNANWVWFASGLYNENLPNLWQQEILKR